MSPLALLEFRLEELTVIEPLRIKHIAIHIIVKYPNVNYQYNVQLTYNELRVPESYLKIVYLRF